MQSEITTVILFGEGDTEQEVRVEYDLESHFSFFSGTEYLLTRVKVLDTVVIEPNDLSVDVRDQIAFQECLPIWRVRMECTPEVNITAELAKPVTI